MKKLIDPVAEVTSGDEIGTMKPTLSPSPDTFAVDSILSDDQLSGMSYSAFISDPRPRLRARQKTAKACVAASLADAMGDLAGWSLPEKERGQDLLIRTLGGLRRQGTTFVLAAEAASRLFGRPFSFSVSSLDFDQVVGLHGAARVVIGLASPSAGHEGHAYHVLGGSYPIRDKDESWPEIVLTGQRQLDDMLEVVRLWDPASGSIEDVPYGVVRARYEARRREALVIRRTTIRRPFRP